MGSPGKAKPLPRCMVADQDPRFEQAVIRQWSGVSPQSEHASWFRLLEESSPNRRAPLSRSSTMQAGRRADWRSLLLRCHAVGIGHAARVVDTGHWRHLSPKRATILQPCLRLLVPRLSRLLIPLHVSMGQSLVRFPKQAPVLGQGEMTHIAKGSEEGCTRKRQHAPKSQLLFGSFGIQFERPGGFFSSKPHR